MHAVHFLWLGVLLVSCTAPAGQAPLLSQALPSAAVPSGAPWRTADPSDTPRPTLPTASAAASPTQVLAAPTRTLRPSATASPTATPPPPPVFTTRLLRPYVTPHTYIADACEALRLRWSPQGSPPGAVVAPIMFHGIRQAGRPIPEGDLTTVSAESFQAFVAYARRLGFQTVTSAQLAAFLTHNAPIPPRSMILIVDDRNVGTVENHFLPALQENHWTVTMGWIIADTNQSLWERVERLNQTGLVDIQSHGYLHRYMTADTPEEVIREEIFGPLPVFEKHFGKRPIAFVWPGGNFTLQTVQIAREAGYELAFTANTNGPLLFNWIPLRAEEGAVGDPLMVLPRYWSRDASLALDQAVKFAEQARRFALEQYPAEARWYRAVCGGELPALGEVLSDATHTPPP